MSAACEDTPLLLVRTRGGVGRAVGIAVGARRVKGQNSVVWRTDRRSMSRPVSLGGVVGVLVVESGRREGEK